MGHNIDPLYHHLNGGFQLGDGCQNGRRAFLSRHFHQDQHPSLLPSANNRLPLGYNSPRPLLGSERNIDIEAFAHD
jgi:hypothetical protein